MAFAPEVIALTRELAPRIEAEGGLPAELREAYASEDLFRLFVPRSLGGPETEVREALGKIEAVAAGSGSAGWCVMVAATTGLLAAYLPEEEAARAFSDPRAVTGGAYMPKGRAEDVEGGRLVSGRWPLASGSKWCEWLCAGCVVEGGRVEIALFPATDARIVETWEALGMRGTASNDIVLDAVFVPSGRFIDLAGGRPREDGPLYRFPLFGLLACSVAAVACGVASSAIEDFAELAGVKVPAGSRRRLVDRPSAQAAHSHAVAAIGAGRAGLHAAVGEAWAEAESGAELSLERRGRVRAAASFAVESAAGAIDGLWRVAGASPVYDTSPLQRHFRDIHVITQHAAVGEPTWELAGRPLLGVEGDTSLL